MTRGGLVTRRTLTDVDRLACPKTPSPNTFFQGRHIENSNGMKRLFTLRAFIAVLLFGAVNSLVFGIIGEVAVDYWGRPRGVAYGIFGYYY